MDRDELQRAGVHLPALPTFITGGLPSGPDWPPILIRHGIDLVSSGQDPDDDTSLARSAEASPYRPVKACGTVARLDGRVWLVDTQDVPDGALGIDPSCVITGTDGTSATDPNVIASTLLPLVQGEPSKWWITARGLAGTTPEEAERVITVLAEGVHYVRLYIAKHQFDLE